MAKSKKFELPKYLRLAKGIMWLDVDGNDSSGVRLYRNTNIMVGRGCDLNGVKELSGKKNAYMTGKPNPRTNEAEKLYPLYEESINKHFNYEVGLDKNENKNSQDGEYGSIENDGTEFKSWFCTTDVPKEKLGKILTAYQNNILVKHDPKITLKEHAATPQTKDFGFGKDGDVVFTGTNKQMYTLLMNKSFKDVKAFIDGCGSSAQQNLMDLYQYEVKGFNKLDRPRAEILDSIRSKLNTFGPSLSSITTGELDED